MEYAGYMNQRDLKAYVRGESGPLNPTAVAHNARFEKIKNIIARQDFKQCINRYTWLGLPPEVPPEMIEKILYYRGQGCFFYKVDKFYFLPFAPSQSPDVYGRYHAVTPLIFRGSTEDTQWISDMFLEPVYGENDIPTDTSCVILRDGTPDFADITMPKYSENKVLIEMLAEIQILILKNLKNSIKRFAIVVRDEAQIEVIEEELKKADIEFMRDDYEILCVKSMQEMQELRGTQPLQVQDYWESYKSLDDFRLGINGITNSGVFRKKERMLADEQGIDSSNSSLVANDDYVIRQRFCELVNYTFGLQLEVMKTEDLGELVDAPTEDEGEGVNEEV